MERKPIPEPKHNNIVKTCISDALLARLDRQCVQRDESKSFLIREAIRLYLKLSEIDVEAPMLPSA